jgi:hypothetical protein
VSLQYPFRNYLLLYGASAKAEVINYVRTECIPEEQNSLSQIVAEWEAAGKTFRKIEESGAGEAERIEVKDIPAEYFPKLHQIEEDFLFKQSFSLIPYEFKLVEIDPLVASQRAVNLDYVAVLKERIPPNPSMSDLIDLCLSPKTQVKLPAEQVLAQNAYSYTSENLDFRFLGGFQKQLTQEDIQACTAGGYPLAAIVLLVGLGAGSTSVMSYQNRFVLANGFHRAFALRSSGVTHIPVVVQRVANPQLEFPPVLANLPREYLLGAPRPALLKDFLNQQLTRKLRVKARNRVVQVQWAANQFNMPIVG